jgi:hypothetical protein
MLFWHGYTLIFSAPHAEYKKFTARSLRTTRDRKSLFSHISASHGDSRSPYRCNKSFWHGYTLIFSAPCAEYTIYSKNLAYQQGQKTPLPTHHSISWRIAATTQVKPMSWLPNIVASVSPHLRMDMYLYQCFNCKYYHIYHIYWANCLAVVGVITGVRTEWHKLQSQQWRRDVV